MKNGRLEVGDVIMYRESLVTITLVVVGGPFRPRNFFPHEEEWMILMDGKEKMEANTGEFWRWSPVWMLIVSESE